MVNDLYVLKWNNLHLSVCSASVTGHYIKMSDSGSDTSVHEDWVEDDVIKYIISKKITTFKNDDHDLVQQKYPNITKNQFKSKSFLFKKFNLQT